MGGAPLRAIAASRTRTEKRRQELADRSGTWLHCRRQPTSPEVGFPQVEESAELKALGTHIVCELSGCDPKALSDVDGVHAMMVAAARAANATILQSSFHRFEPQGVSGTVILAESHLSIHTWPEKKYAAMDFYTCGDHTDPWLACLHAAKVLSAKRMLTTEFKRGIEAKNGTFTHVVTATEAKDRPRTA